MNFICCCYLLAPLIFSSCNSAIPNHEEEFSSASVANHAAKNSTGETRYGMVTGLKADKIEDYKKLHAAAWPQVKKKITECNIHNYSIYLKEIDGKFYLFSYWEYTGEDFDADMKNMAADSTTQEWWKLTAPMQLPLPEAAEKGETWSRMEEVFHQD